MRAQKYLKKCRIDWKMVFLVVFGLLISGGTVNAEALAPNEMGLIPVLEYHRLGNAERSFTRSTEDFRNDLEWLYNNDYVLISVSDFINQRFSLPRGKKAVTMSFDDSTISQFHYLEDGSIDPESAIGILDAFYKKHPDFGRSAIFFVNTGFFEQKQFKKKKLEYLLATGREIGNHTYNHVNIAKMPADQIRTELGGLAQYLNNLLLREIAMTSFSYPFGGVPKEEEALVALRKGTYNGISYQINAAFLVGADPSHAPYSVKFEELNIPRIQALDEEWKRWFGREAGTTAAISDSELFGPFVSDGCEKIVTFPEKRLANFDKTKLAAELEVCISDKEDCEAKLKACTAVAVKPDVRIDNSSLESAEVSSGSGAAVTGSESFTQNEALNSIEDRGVFQHWKERGLRHLTEIWTEVGRKIPEFKVNTLPTELLYQGNGFYYQIQGGDTLAKIAGKFLEFTRFYLLGQLQEAIKEENNLGDNPVLNVGEQIAIPGVEVIIYDRKIDIDERKGIYWTAYTASSKNALEQIKRLKEVGGNTVVFDVKDVEGVIFYNSNIPFAKQHDLVRVRIPDLPKLVRTLHGEGIYTIARMTVFKDMALGKVRPDLAPKSPRTGKPWENREGVVWMDPARTEVQDYNTAVAEEVAKMGVDEVQFDYIRFPERTREDGDFSYDENKQSREDVIVQFLERTKLRLAPLGVRLSADVFGVVAWNNGYDGRIVGQNVAGMSKYLEVIYPMVYPSHFGPGFAGRSNPGGEPYYFVNESLKKFVAQADRDTEIIPWIQGFAWGATGYGTDYVRKQIQAARDLGINSFLIWNAANNYDVSWGAF